MTSSPAPRVRQYRTVSQRAIQSFVALFLLAWLIAGAGFFLSVRALQGEIGNRATTAQVCRGDNEARAQQVQLWTYIIAISAPPPHETPAHRQQREATVAKFRAYIGKVFAPRDCGRLSGG